MNNEATTYAQQQSDAFKKSLQYLIDQQNQQNLLDEQATTQRYQSLLTQINQGITPINQQYESDAKQAYINKMLSQKDIDSTLNQLGLNTQGFGVTQQALNETAYGNNLSTAKTTKATGLQNIQNQVVNATGDYNTDMLTVKSNNQSKLTQLMQAIEQQGQSKYQTSYENFMNEKQYKDQLAQQAWENDFNNRQLYANSSSAPFGGGGNTSNTPHVVTDYYNDAMPASTYSDLQLGAFNTRDKNGVKYQPSYINGNKIQKSIGKVADVAGNGQKNSSGFNIDNQKVWQLADGSTWIWNGSKMKYEQVIIS